MKKTILFCSVLLTILACNNDEKEQTPSPSKTELLTGGASKTWYVFSTTPDDRCASGSDDTWTFYADGTLTYDHGTVTEDEQGECSDLINFEGTWSFANNETVITIIALRAAGASEDMDEPLTIASGTVTTLTGDRMVITLQDQSATVELRKR